MKWTKKHFIELLEFFLEIIKTSTNQIIQTIIISLFITIFSILLSFGQNIAELKQKAEQGDAKAQLALGECYIIGYGIEKDPREAVKWFRKVAEQGNAKAQCNLGWCYDNGKGIEKDFSEAVKWVRKAAEQGYAKAQYNLGVCYAVGNGVIQNNVKAYAWWALASANGNENAREVMNLFKKDMTPNQIADAQKIAEKYYNGKFD